MAPLARVKIIICVINGYEMLTMIDNMGLSWKVDVNEFMNFPQLIILSFQNNSLWGNVMNFSFNHKMKIINLSGNKLDGPIPGSLPSLSVLESLQLQDNNLTGTIPEFNQSSILFFNVSNNNLTGSIPKTQTLQSFGSDSYSGNPGLYGPPLTATSRSINGTGEPPSGNSPPNSNGDIFKNIFLVFVVLLIVAVILLLILYCQKAQMVKKMLNEANKEEAGEGEKIIEAAERSIVVAAEESRNLVLMEDEPAFEIRDVLRASAEGLGKGIFGNSYKAKASGGPSVVVKRLRDLKPMTSEEFKRQLRMIGDMKHPNLLPLLAYYYSNEEKFLLYNYAAKGNLFDRIHGESGGDRIPFRWDARLSVARGVARALEYLQLNTKRQSIVPHGNLKSSNVLFDENDKVLVSDYGLASLLALPIAIQHMERSISARTAPPGVNGTVDLSSWVHRALREEWTAEVFDLEISMQRNAIPGMLRLLQIAMQCCDNTPEERPEMTQVVREVENIKVPESGDENDGSLEDGSLSTSGTGEEK